MRKFLIFINSILVLIIGYVTWPGNSQILKTNYPSAYEIAAYIVIIGGVLVNLFANLIPLWEEQRLLKIYRRSSAFNAAAEAFVEKYKSYNISLNVMIEATKYFDKKSSYKFRAKYFEVVWQLGDTLSNQLCIATNQAIYGEAFKDGHQTGVHGGPVTSENFDDLFINCDDDQKKFFNEFLFVGSCAIPNATNILKSIGLLNIETKSQKAIDIFIKNPKKLEILYVELKSLAKIYEGILV